MSVAVVFGRLLLGVVLKLFGVEVGVGVGVDIGGFQ
jgi:hypothetical protein